MSDERNLLEETIRVMASDEKAPGDVAWVGTDDVWFTWAEFAAVADKTYSAGFGSQEVAADLKVCFSDGSWLARDEYDGAEGWEYFQFMTKPDEHFVPARVIGRYWPTLHNLHDPEYADHNWSVEEGSQQ